MPPTQLHFLHISTHKSLDLLNFVTDNQSHFPNIKGLLWNSYLKNTLHWVLFIWDVHDLIHNLLLGITILNEIPFHEIGVIHTFYISHGYEYLLIFLSVITNRDYWFGKLEIKFGNNKSNRDLQDGVKTFRLKRRCTLKAGHNQADRKGASS